MTDREALAAALTATWSERVLDHETIILAAARERLAQLPEKCPRGGKSCIDGIDTGSIPQGAADCSVCHGSGKVYPAELVERIASIIFEIGHPNNKAVAVLDALNRETE